LVLRIYNTNPETDARKRCFRAEGNRSALMLTPLVLEIIAKKTD